MDIEGFILAGGRSSRFGENKSEVQFEGRSLTDRTAGTIQKAFPSARVTLVAADPLQLVTLPSGLPFVLDIYEGRGPFGAVHAALANSRAEWAFIAACDLPLVTSELISRLGGFVSEETDAVAPMQPDGNVQPLCSFYRVKPCLAAVEKLLERDRPSPPVKAIFDEVRTKFVEFEKLRDIKGSENFFLNMNSRDDLERALAISKLE